MQTIKNLYGKKKKCIYKVPIMIKFFICLSHHHCYHLMRWNNIENQICSSEINNDNIDKGANIIN